VSELIDSLREALRANPEATPLALHLAELLLDDGQIPLAIAELGSVLSREPTNAKAQQLLQRALGTAPASTPAAGSSAEPTRAAIPESAPPDEANAPAHGAVDWDKLEREVGVDIAPPFVSDGSGSARVGEHGHPADDDAFIRISGGEQAAFVEEPQRERITLADVGGLDDVKQRLRVAFLEPMRNPAIAKAYGKSLRGGLLLYGPPGTGKTFLAKAIAGELGAQFLTVTVADILDGVMGESEKNVHRAFERARELAPCVLFIDELDSLGGKRSGYSNVGWMRSVVNQLLQEMDGVGSDNDGVFILAATNHPWDVDNALLRPGRFDRVVLVTPPDPAARAAILRHALEDRPISGIDLDQVVAATDGFTGADLTHLVASAAERAMTDSIASGELRPIGMDDLRAALVDVKPSAGPWLQSARNVVEFANVDGRYDDLQAYLSAVQATKAKKPRR
jgi:AAA+ superfamily predicted ATPase